MFEAHDQIHGGFEAKAVAQQQRSIDHQTEQQVHHDKIVVAWLSTHLRTTFNLNLTQVSKKIWQLQCQDPNFL